jgi:spermidine synthase
LEVYRKPARYAPERVAPEFAQHASWLAISSVGAMIAFLCFPPVFPTQYLRIVLPVTLLAFVVPFVESGVCIALLLTRLPYAGGWLYAADLAGAGLGCLGIILALFTIDPVSAVLWIGAFAAGAGWIVVRGSDRVIAGRVGCIAIVLAAAAAVHTGLYLSGYEHLRVLWSKGTREPGAIFERWNTYSRVRVVPLGESTPMGWGFAHTPQTKIDQDILDIDASASTPITRLDGDISKLTYLEDDVINAAYLVQTPAEVGVIGVGGGRDILSALFFGARHITGIEINPAIFEALNNKFADFSGHLNQQPGVSLVNAEARSYINHSSKRYDLIQISVVDTWAAIAAGGLTLTENRLYTVEAWSDFYRALNPGGLLSVSRWYDHPVSRLNEFYRLVAIAVSALQRMKIRSVELRQHIIAVNAGHTVTVISRPDAFTEEQWKAARRSLEAQGFKILLGPDVSFDTITSTLLSGDGDGAFFDSLPENIAPSTDDNPFFFFTERLGNIAKLSSVPLDYNGSSINIVCFLIIGALCACVYYIVVPFVRLAKSMTLSTLTPPVVFFSAIGMGFMLIEISQMQRLMVFLGEPVYGLGVVLFAILLFSGLGSATVGAHALRPNAVIVRVIALLTALAVTGMLTFSVTSWGRSQVTDMRILLSVLLLAPPAFFMGMMFPLGLSIWRRHSELLPYFWCANGMTSMLASVLGMVLSMQFGIANTYAIGVCFYVISAFMIVSIVWRYMHAELST